MKYLISESQRKLLFEEVNERVKEVQEDGMEFTKKVVNDVQENTSMNLKMMLTWGASIGGFMGPVMQYLNGEYPDITQKDASLIAVGIASVIFFQEKPFVKSLIEKIKEQDLEEAFKTGAMKANQLKGALADFLKSLNVITFSVSNMLSYAFLVPIIPMIYDAVAEGVWDINDAEMLTKSLVSFGLITISGNFLKRLIDTVVKRILR
jgi:hypothetical protein